MNRKQKICLLAGITVIVVMGLYPPWLLEIDEMLILDHHTFIIDGFYAWIGHPPYPYKTGTEFEPYTADDRYMEQQIRVIGIDWYHLIIQFVVVAFFTFYLFLFLGINEENWHRADK